MLEEKYGFRLHHGGRTTGENCSRNEAGNARFPAAALKSREGWLEVEDGVHSVRIWGLLRARFVLLLGVR